MEIEVARKLEEMSFEELLDVLQKFQMEDFDAFLTLKEIVEDI